ncbi:uncharacterized protein LOC128321251 [Pangasianodon hypophthalmus]|uniref:uncharacterized protein LOC128321251 n=1 Tax=Pangasianodon hypophthalmus TaxID=310915 RepID=UPI002307B6B1|nr:uncharacterized protein LOC128321251 [Pangasianodon hypophthalmus]
MAAEMGSANENSSSFLHTTHAMDWNYYNWCTDYPTARITWSTISMICFFLGLPVNVWVLHELLPRQRQKATSDFIMLSLAVINLIFTAQIPFCVFNFMAWHSTELQIIFVFIFNISVQGRPLFMAYICLDCYVAVVYPIEYKASRKLAVIKKIITIIMYFIIAGFGLLTCTITWLFTTPFVALPLIMALPVISFCDISILRALRKPDPTGKNKIHPQKKRALHTIFNSFIMTFVVYLPPAIIFSFGNLLPLEETVRYCCITPYGYCFSTAGCIIMPVLYLVSVDKLDIFKNCWKK